MTTSATARTQLNSTGTDTAQMWLSNPVQAHLLWREQQVLFERDRHDEEHARPYAAQSTAQYRSMFARFCAFLREEGTTLQALNADQVDRFITGLRGRPGVDGRERAASIRTQRMYLSEIHRVMGRLMELGLRENAATERSLHLARMKKPLVSRSVSMPAADQVALLRAHIQKLLAGGEEADFAQPRELMAAAMATLILSAGMTIKELQKVRLASLLPGSTFTAARPEDARVVLRAPGHRMLKMREVQLTGWDALCVLRWWRLHTWRRQAAQNDGLKMAGRGKLDSGKAFSLDFGRTAAGNTFIHRAIRALGEAASLPEASAQRLRNAFMAGLIAQDVPESQIAERAGLCGNDQVQFVRRAMGRRLRRAAHAAHLPALRA